MTFIIDFDCHWDDSYPVEHTCGTFPLHAKDELTAIYFIKRNFLNHPSLLNYYFIIDDGQNIMIISKKGE